MPTPKSADANIGAGTKLDCVKEHRLGRRILQLCFHKCLATVRACSQIYTDGFVDSDRISLGACVADACFRPDVAHCDAELVCARLSQQVLNDHIQPCVNGKVLGATGEMPPPAAPLLRRLCRAPPLLRLSTKTCRTRGVRSSTVSATFFNGRECVGHAHKRL